MVTTNVRFEDQDEKLLDVIKQTAKQNRRSMNAEILRAIEYYLKNAPEAQYQVDQAKPSKKVVKAKKET